MVKIVGALLVTALLVTPASTAQLIGRSFKSCLVWTQIFGLSSVIIGLYLSAEYDAGPGAAISLVAAEEALLLKAIEKFIGIPLPKVDVVGFEQKILKAEPLKQGGQRQRRTSQAARMGRKAKANSASSQQRRSKWKKTSNQSKQRGQSS